jgi:hypothetical protein
MCIRNACDYSQEGEQLLARPTLAWLSGRVWVNAALRDYAPGLCCQHDLGVE